MSSAEVLGTCPTCDFPIKDGYPLTYCPKCGKDLPDELVTPPEPAAPSGPMPVAVVDLEIPFGSMVRLMVKWAIASLPAFFILFVLAAIVFVVFGSFASALFMR